MDIFAQTLGQMWHGINDINQNSISVQNPDFSYYSLCFWLVIAFEIR